MRNAYILLHTIKHMKTIDETQIPITFEANRIVIIEMKVEKRSTLCILWVLAKSELGRFETPK